MFNKKIIFPYETLSSTEEECQYISTKIFEFNLKQLGILAQTSIIPQNFVIKNKEEIIAGINAFIYWNILCIDVLFVQREYRSKGIGAYLLHKVEEEAKQIGVTLSHLDTFDFQAKDFYLKKGYEIFGILENCPKNHKCFYMKKVL